MSADDEAIATFTATASAVDYFEMHNGTGGVELHSEGTSADVNITLAPKGDGLVLAPADTTCQVALVRLSLRKTMLTVQQLVP